MSAIKERAAAIAARVDESKVSFDPILIIGILTQVLPLRLQCFQRNDEPDPAKIRSAAVAANERNPVAFRRRTARRIRAEADEPMSKSESFALAEAVIAEACEADDSTASALLSECL